ncbi:MAG: hypothetical protein V5A27_13250 [Halapricum sp.]
MLADRLPNAELLTFRNAPHLFFVEEAIQVNEHLTVFLEDVHAIRSAVVASQRPGRCRGTDDTVPSR